MSQSDKKWQKNRTQQHLRYCKKCGRRTQDRNHLRSKLNPACIASTFYETQEEACPCSGTLVDVGPLSGSGNLGFKDGGREREEERDMKRKDTETQSGHKGKESGRKLKI